MQPQQLYRSQDRMHLASCTRLMARVCTHVLPAPTAATAGVLQGVSRLCAAAREASCTTTPLQDRCLFLGTTHAAGVWHRPLTSTVCAASTSAGRSTSSSGRVSSSSSSSRKPRQRPDRTLQDIPSDGRPPPAAKQRGIQERAGAAPRPSPGTRTRRGPPPAAPAGTAPPPATTDWWEVEEDAPRRSKGSSSQASSSSSSRQDPGSSSSSSTAGAPATTTSSSSHGPSRSQPQAAARPRPEGGQPPGTPSTPPAPAPQPLSSSSSSVGASDRPLPVPLSEAQVASMASFLDYLLTTNTVMNLTSVRDPQEAWERHVGDSLSLLPLLDTLADGGRAGGGSGGVRLLDVGTGPGLPGMILALARPHWQVVLMDSLKKRTTFLERAVAHLGVTNVTVVWGRAETLARKQALRESFDLVVARAVAELPVLAELCLPFVAPGGAWVAAKGADIQDEVDAARPAITICGGRLRGVSPVDSWSPLGQRTAVVVDKVGPISNILPRRPGTPSATPLTAKDAYKYGRRAPAQGRRG